jgi:hypothetical protein
VPVPGKNKRGIIFVLPQQVKKITARNGQKPTVNQQEIGQPAAPAENPSQAAGPLPAVPWEHEENQLPRRLLVVLCVLRNGFSRTPAELWISP